MGAGMQSKDKRMSMKKRFSAKRIALMAVFVALAYIVSWLDFPIFPAVPFLQLDFGNVFILLIAFLLGPMEGVVVCALKEGLRILGSNSGGVGELANMLMTTSFILLPSIVYQWKKGLKVVLPSLVLGCCIGTATAMIVNRFITFPLYLKDAGVAVFTDGFWFILAFNLIKTVSVSVLTLLLYKRLSNYLKSIKI